MYRCSIPSSASGGAGASRRRNYRGSYDISNLSTVSFPNGNGAASDFEPSTLVAFMSPSSYQAQLLSSFIQDLSSRHPADIGFAFHYPGPWVTDIATSTSVSTTLMWSIRALSLSHLGHQVEDRYLIQNSKAMYGKALVHLKRSLQDPIDGFSTDTLSATALLCAYEMVTSTERYAWVQVSCYSLPEISQDPSTDTVSLFPQHAGGTAMLVQMRGPNLHRTGRDGLLFLSCRWACLQRSFQTRSKCFLTEPEWRALSRHLAASSPRRSRLSDAIEDGFQTILDIPDLIWKAVDYIDGSEADPTQLQELIDQTHLFRASYKRVQTRIEDALPEAGMEPTRTVLSKNDKIFPVVYQYPNFMIGESYCYYWTVMSTLNVVLIGLEAKLQPVTASRTTASVVALDMGIDGASGKAYLVRATENLDNPTFPAELWALPPADGAYKSPLITVTSPKEYPTVSVEDTLKRRNLYVEENIHYAREACRSVKYMHTAALIYSLSLVNSLRVAIRTLRDREEKAWVMEKLGVISKNCGIAKIEAEIYRERSGQRST